MPDTVSIMQLLIGIMTDGLLLPVSLCVLTDTPLQVLLSFVLSREQNTNEFGF